MPRVEGWHRDQLQLHDARAVAALPVNPAELTPTASLRFRQQVVLTRALPAAGCDLGTDHRPARQQPGACVLHRTDGTAMARLHVRWPVVREPRAMPAAIP